MENVNSILNNFIKGLTLEHLSIGIFLVILTLWLKRFHPPLKEQWQALIVFTVGATISHILVNSWLYGVSITGVIFYKEIFINELIYIKNILLNKKN